MPLPAHAQVTDLKAGVAGVRPIDLHAPMRLTVYWLAGTYIMFLLLGDTDQVTNLPQLSLFIAATVSAFVIGYKAKALGYRGQLIASPEVSSDEAASTRRWVAIAGIYFAVYGLALLQLYGATSPGQLLTAITDPGGAYLAKFNVYEQLDTGVRAPVIQVATLLAGVGVPLVPLTLLYWRDLTGVVRGVALLGASLFASYFLYIGTLKGLGDFLIYGAAAVLILRKGSWRGSHEPMRRSARIGVGVAVLIFLGYMVYAQTSRLDTFDVSATKYQSGPVVTAIVGEKLGRGVAVTLAYPTHGYVGLSKNLQTPPKWTYGRGASRAVESYWVQYIGGPSIAMDTYPERTEARTGYPAGQLWTTIYPWLASDVGWIGAALFPMVLGWWMARLWFEAAFRRDRLAVVMFVQVALLTAFIPANNQIGLSRVGLIAFVSTALVYAASRPERNRSALGSSAPDVSLTRR